MKILRIIQEFYPLVSGPVKQVYHVSRYLQQRGHSCLIFTSTAGAEDRPREEVVQGVMVRRFTVRAKFMRSYFIPAIVPAIQKDDFDVIHVHGPRNFASDAAILVARLRKKPVVLQCHGTLLGYRRMITGIRTTPYRLYDLVFKGLIPQKADAVIASTTQEYQECLEYGFSPEKIHVIPAGIDLEDFPEVRKNHNSKPTRLLFVGRISRDRNLEQILQALSRLHVDRDDFVLHIVGREEKSSSLTRGGYIEDLKLMVGELGLENHVTFAGPKYGDDLIEQYCSADIFVYTSLYESFGNVILEAAAASLPIISTPVGVARDLVIDGQTGVLVDFAAESLEWALRRLVQDSGKAAEMGRNAQRLVRQRYQWKGIVDKYESLYRQLAR